MNNSTSTSVTYFIYKTSITENQIKFIILLILQFLSIPCFLYIFYQFLRQPHLRQLQHHVTFSILIISFLFVTISLPITQSYLFKSHIDPANPTFCSFWNWLHYSLNITNLFLMTFSSLEKNWLIFHSSLTRNKFGKLIFHYFPLIFCLFYPSLFYIYVIFIYKCKSYYNYTQLLCKWPCYFYNENLTNFDLYANNYIPLLLIPICCAIIYIRVLIQKRAMQQQIFRWRRDKKLILQLLVTSSLYLAMWMPIELTGLINTYWDPWFLLQFQIDYLYLFPYFIHLIFPFIVLLIFHQDMLKFRRIRPVINTGPHHN